TAAEDRLSFRRHNPHTSFAAASDCRKNSNLLVKTVTIATIPKFSGVRGRTFIQPESHRIPHLPIVSAAVKWLEPTPWPGPVPSHGRIPIVNLLDQLRDRPPAKLTRDLCSNLKINARNKEVSSRFHQAGDVPQTIFCSRRLHVAQKVARYHHVLRPKDTDQFRS